MDLTFAYGSNMNIEDLRDWLEAQGFSRADVAPLGVAVLKDFRLVWNYFSTSRGGGAANVEPFPKSSLYGLLLEVTPAGLEALDKKEGHPKYYSRGSSRMKISLVEGGDRDAWVYIANHEKCSSSPVLPKRQYLSLILDAAKQHRFPKQYVVELQNTKTVD